jgi:flagellar motility protein MotE (MotC chaperone)
MVESGSDGLLTAAQILARMKDRRAAAVLSAFQDKAMAADLAEKMVGLKQAAAPPPGKGTRGPATDK